MYKYRKMSYGINRLIKSKWPEPMSITLSEIKYNMSQYIFTLLIV